MTATQTFTPQALDSAYKAERPAFVWLFEREVLRFLRIWRYTLFGPVLSSVLFVIVFASALGRHVAAIDGFPYGKFIVPGLFTQAIVTVGFVNGTTTIFEARLHRYIHDVFASPLRWWEINAAIVAGGMVRGVIVGAGVLAVSFPLTGGGSVPHPLVLTLGTLGLLAAAAQLGVVAGSLAKSQDHVYSMESIILLPLGFLGGVFYSIGRLPTAWRVLSYLDPVFWVVQVERIGFLGRGDVSALLAVAVVWSLATALSLWSASIFAIGRLKP
jgi:ABC-2 type transport system permease protein